MRTLIAVVLILAVCTPVAFTRTWTDSTGKHTVEGEFVDLKDGTVRLKKEDGKTITIPIETLSEADRDFVKAQNGANVVNDEVRTKAARESLQLLGTCLFVSVSQTTIDMKEARKVLQVLLGKSIADALPGAVHFLAGREKELTIACSKTPDISAVKEIMGKERSTRVRGVLREQDGLLVSLDMYEGAEKGSLQALLWYDYGSLSFGTIDGKVRAVLVAFQGNRLVESQQAGKHKEHGLLEKITAPGNKRIQLDVAQVATDSQGDLVSDYPAIRDEASKICDKYASRLRSEQDVRDLAQEIGGKLKVVAGKSVGITVRNVANEVIFVGDVKANADATFDMVERSTIKASDTQRSSASPFEPYELTAEEAKKYRADQSQANLALTGNIFDNQTGMILLTDEQIKEIRGIGSKLNFKKPTDRFRYVKEFVRILGEKRARKVGIIFCDSDGRAKYVWPKPGTVEPAR